MIRASHLLPAGCAGRGNMGPLESCACSYSLYKISMAVFAHPRFQPLRNPYAVSHSYSPCQPDIPVASLGMCFEFLACKHK
jgi:hypothetical protein